MALLLGPFILYQFTYVTVLCIEMKTSQVPSLQYVRIFIFYLRMEHLSLLILRRENRSVRKIAALPIPTLISKLSQNLSA